MEKQEIIRIRELQREFYKTGRTQSVRYRIEALKTLREIIHAREDDILAALESDLGKSGYEGFFSEVGMVYDELGAMIRNLPRYARTSYRMTPLAQFPSNSFSKPSPRGTVLIMSPWNYPFLLTMDPLIDALAAGNTAMVKPSAYSPATSKIIGEIVETCFPERYVAVVTGGRAENTYLLDEAFDMIFFTGSYKVGQLVMEKAAKHMTPVVLELGGKSPCIVDRTANIPLAARRIVWGKFLNVGQTCVAPDYIYCEASVKEELAAAIRAEIVRQFGPNPLTNKNYGHIVNKKHFDRLCGLIDASKDKVYTGGRADEETLRIEPTVMTEVTREDAVMGEEIFGPVLPIMTFDQISDAIDDIEAQPHPLALYLFTRSKENRRRVLTECTFGGGCVNDTIIHLATTRLGFGGVGASGMGAYHGKIGFETFSHRKNIVHKAEWLDLPMRYQPFKKKYMGLLRFFMH